MSALRGVVWDLDDTLFLERDYVRSGFGSVADRVARTPGVDRDAAFALLWSDFEAGVRGDAFNRLLAAFPSIGEPIPALVRVYREHAPSIDCAPGAPALLDELRSRGIHQGVISDGPLASQRAKADALGVARWCDPVVLTDAWGREFWKPNPRAYVAVAAAWGLPGDALAYVGDNPGKDFVAPNALGWHTIRLRLPEQVRGDQPDGDSPAGVTVRSIAELRELLLGALDWGVTVRSIAELRPGASG